MTIDYKALTLDNVTHFDDMTEFLTYYNMTADDFEEDNENGFIMCITRGTYNGATDAFTPWDLSDDTLIDTIIVEVRETDFKTIFWDYAEGSEDDPATWSEYEAAFMFSLFHEVVTIGNEVYSIDK